MGGGEGDFGPAFGGEAERKSVAGEEDGGVVAVVAEGGLVGFDEVFQAFGVGAGNPAGGDVGGGFEADGDLVFGVDAGLQDVELEGADDADDPVSTQHRAEDLGDTFLGEVFEGAAELFGFHRVGQDDAAEDFGGEAGDAGETEGFAFGQRVAHAERAVVGDADDVAGEGFLGEGAVLGEEEDRGLDGHRLAGADVEQFHAALEAARADAGEGDAVAVVGVHVGLDLEDEAGDGFLIRADGVGFGALGGGRRGVFGEEGEEFEDAVILQRGAEDDGGEVTGEEGFAVEGGVGAGEFDGIAQVGHLLVGDGDGFGGFAIRGDAADGAVGADVPAAAEEAAHADGPDEGADVEREGVRDFIEERKRVLAFAVDLVDEGDDRDVAQAADLEELEGLGLDAAGGVDDHDGGVDRGEGAVGVFGEVLVAGRVEQVEDDVVPGEGHDRGGDGDAALAFDGHPVRAGVAALAAGLDHAGLADGAAEEEELLGQGGLAGVGVGDDREGAAGEGAGAGGGSVLRERCQFVTHAQPIATAGLDG